MSNKFTITHFNEADWQEYKSIRLESLEADPQAFSSSLERELAFDEARWKSRLKEYSATSKSINLGLRETETGKYIGTVGAFSSEPNIVTIVGCYVSPIYRGQKLASQLMQELIKMIVIKDEFTKIQLSVNKDQIAAIMLYKKFGFVVIEEHLALWGNGTSQNELIMELVLN